MKPNKTGIRWWIFTRFGPPEIQNLIRYIDEISNDGDTDILIYPYGSYKFQIKTSDDQRHELMEFPTPQERDAFQRGIAKGVSIMGGDAHDVNEQFTEEMEAMNKKATHGSGGGRDN